jgi:hypothetical protein
MLVHSGPALEVRALKPNEGRSSGTGAFPSYILVYFSSRRKAYSPGCPLILEVPPSRLWPLKIRGCPQELRAFRYILLCFWREHQCIIFCHLEDGKKIQCNSFQRISEEKMCQGCHFSRKNSLKLAYGSN